MGIFSKNYLESAYGTTSVLFINENDQLRFIQTETAQMFDSLYQLCEDAEDMIDENEVLQESFIDDFKDQFKSMITLITRGREAMLDQSQKAAAECEDYIKELDALSRNTNQTKAKIYENMEVYEIVMCVGNSYISYTEYRNALYGNKIFDLDNIKKNADSGMVEYLKKEDKKYKKWVTEICRFHPVIRSSKTKKLSVAQLAKILKDIQSENKAFSSDYRNRTTKMIENINKGMNMINAESDKLTIKYLKKFVKFQKQIYSHDTILLNSHNMMILRQCRYIKKFINKNS